MKLYRKEDIKAINENIDTIITKSIELKNEILEPTLVEFKNIIKVVLEFAKKKKRIIYGGYALNVYLKHHKKEPIYNDNLDMYDIEFYSSKALEDSIEIADLLNSKDFKYVQAKEGIHNETYKIFVNFKDIVDITYMPGPIYHKLQYIEIEGIRYIHPELMFIDKLRMYNNLITTFWRIEKEIKRTNMILEYLDIFKIPKDCKENVLDAPDYIRKDIIPKFNNTCIAIGYYAYYYYLFKYTNKEVDLKVPYYEIISTNFYEDCNKIYELLNQNLHNITTKEFYPFSQYLDRRIEYYENNKLILIIYKNYNLCIPYLTIEKKNIKVGPFLLTLMYLMINKVLFQVYDKNYNNILCMIQDLLKLREDYLNKNNKTVMDDTPFRDFIVECTGKTMDQIRVSLLTKLKRYNQKKLVTFQYKPGDKINIENFKFKNTSGNIISNPHFHVIKNKDVNQLQIEDLQ